MVCLVVDQNPFTVFLESTVDNNQRKNLALSLYTESGLYQFLQRLKQSLRLYRLGEMGI